MQDTFTLNLNKILHMTVVVVGVVFCTKRFFEGTTSQMKICTVSSKRFLARSGKEELE